MIIAVDFDGTIVEHKYPSIGKARPFAVETLRQLMADGHRLVLWTVRSGHLLDEALEWCEERGIRFYAVNSRYPAGSLFAAKPGDSPKIEADVYIDDRNVGGLPDWGDIYEIISGKAEARRRKHTKPGGAFARWIRSLRRK